MITGGKTVSVVVPVFNVHAYLPDCVASLLTQTYPFTEVILVDDGSTDGSGELCDGYAREHASVRVIHQQNGGLSSARNAGIRAATGEWLLLVDSDDWLASEKYVETLMRAIEEHQADIAVSAMHSQADTKLPAPTCPGRSICLDRVEGMRTLMYSDLFFLSACGKLVRKSLYDGVAYPVGRNYEDLATTYQLFNKACKTVYVPQISYSYRVRDNSIMDQPVQEYLFEMAKSMMEDVARLCPEAGEAALYCFMRQTFCVLTQNYDHLPRERRVKYLRTLRQNWRSILRDGRAAMNFKIKITMVLIAPRLTSRLRRKMAKPR